MYSYYILLFHLSHLNNLLLMYNFLHLFLLFLLPPWFLLLLLLWHSHLVLVLFHYM